jgi:exosortase N
VAKQILPLFQNPGLVIGLMSVTLGVICFPFVRDYLGPEFSVDQIWLLLIPLIVYVQSPGERSMRYAWLAAGSLLLYLLLGAHVFAYFAAGCTLFLILESHFGKLNELSPVALILVTPAVTYVFDIFGFPIRLKLTQLAAGILNVLGNEAAAKGNFILINHQEYSVDAVCMGLNMVVTGLIISLLMMVYHEKKQSKILPRLPIAMILVIAFTFVVLANLLRIVALVLTDFPPESMGHEVVGLGSLMLVVVLPLWFIVREMVTRRGKLKMKNEERVIQTHWKYMIPITLMIILVWVRFDIQNQKEWPLDNNYEEITLGGFQKEVLPLNILRFTRPNTLVYLKPGSGAFRRGHHPAVCWSGGGYEITREEMIEYNGHQIVTAQIVSDTERLYTAWWYDNGKHITVDQFDWRWRVFSGEKDFWLVNVSTTNPDRLMLEIESMMAERDSFIGNYNRR